MVQPLAGTLQGGFLGWHPAGHPAGARSKDILRRGRSFRNRLFAAAQSVFGVESPLLLELGGKPRLPKSPRRRTLDEKIADVKEQLAALEAALEAAKAKKG